MADVRIPRPSDPHLRRWMLFVDGENFTAQAQKLADRNSFRFPEGPFHMRNVFVWMPHLKAKQMPRPPGETLQETALRAHYYTSIQGNDEKFKQAREALWNLGFTPRIFRRPKGSSAKGVDITLTLDVVNHAYGNHYDVAVLIAGDADYVPLVEQVKRLGKGIVVCFFEGKGLGLSDGLRLAADTFFPFDEKLLHSWKKERQQAETRTTQSNNTIR